MSHRRRFDAVFIDFYGTIADGDRAAIERTCARVVADCGLPISAAELAVAWGQRFFAEIEVANHERFLNLYDCECKTLVETLAPWKVRCDPRPYGDMLKRYWAEAPLHPDAREALASLEVPICCVSNADTDDILSAIARHGLRFDRVITSEDVRCYKPDPLIFQRALDAMGVHADRAVHVGDSLHSDVGGAKPVGITTVWLHRDDRIYDAGSAAPHHNIRSLLELRELIS